MNEVRQYAALEAGLMKRYGSRSIYEALGVAPDASQENIRSKFREKAQLYHPDKNLDPHAVQKFKDVNAIFEILSDSQQRTAYDSFRTQLRRTPAPQKTAKHSDTRPPSSPNQDISDRVRAYCADEISLDEMTKGFDGMDYVTATRLVSKHYKNQRVAEAAGRRRDFKSTTDQLGRKLEQILETLISHNS